jgi:hypothetical protein
MTSSNWSSESGTAGVDDVPMISSRRRKPGAEAGEDEQNSMPANQPYRSARAMFGFLVGVATVVGIPWLALVGSELIFDNRNQAVRDFELPLQFIFFSLVLILMWATALVPFVVVRLCGGFVLRKRDAVGSAWHAVAGGIATAILTLPIVVWWGRFLDLENGPGPYLAALAVAMPILLPVVVVCGAIGGLAYWFFTARA